jgi:two-component system chemotaxis response regulator CheY
MKRIAVIDDATFVREMLKKLCEDMGHVIVGEAEDGEQAIQVLEKTLPDIAIIDLVMPKLSGVELLKIVRPQFPQTKVIVCTTLDADEFEKRLEPHLYDGVLRKPFQKEEFEQLMKQLE